ncbi:hypothetical protein HOC35_05175 [Candidatus Woesearchaeota archaeon]|jgi:hypothetical protein|nr:hypothetical protein [Candidatus Woesearchaeota archaeon]
MTINLEDVTNVTTLNIVDVHDTIVAYATPGFGPETISRANRISPDDPEFEKSMQAVDAFNERHGVETPDQELATEEAAIRKGIDYLWSSDCVTVGDEDAHYIIPIKGADKTLREMLEDDRQVVAIVSSSTVQQSYTILSYLIGGIMVQDYVDEGRLTFINAVHPMNDSTEPMSKSNPETWIASYKTRNLHGFANQVTSVNIFENSGPKRQAAVDAAKIMFEKAVIRDYARIDKKS